LRHLRPGVAAVCPQNAQFFPSSVGRFGSQAPSAALACPK
jgi:hypothetical protein